MGQRVEEEEEEELEGNALCKMEEGGREFEEE
jgi:hypothetical protein